MKKEHKLERLGQLIITPGANAALKRNSQLVFTFLSCHAQGDWGDISKEEVQINSDALDYGGSVMSVYHLLDATKLWVITEADRSSTTLLLPEEY